MVTGLLMLVSRHAAVVNTAAAVALHAAVAVQLPDNSCKPSRTATSVFNKHILSKSNTNVQRR